MMEQGSPLSSFTKRQEVWRQRKNKTTSGSQMERRLLRMGSVTLGVLCILQAVLNVSLRLAFVSEEDVDQFPLNSSVITDLCTKDPSQQNSSQQCSCCNNLLKMLLRKYRALETERDLLREQVKDNFEESGSTEGSSYW